MQAVGSDGSEGLRRSPRRSRNESKLRKKDVFPEVKEAQQKGIELLLGGEFGDVNRKEQRKPGRRSPRNLVRSLQNRKRTWRSTKKESVASV